MARLVSIIDKKFYPAFGDHWDDALFRERVLSAGRPDMDVLDVGAGAGIVESMNFKGQFRSVLGIDPDERVASNPNLDKGLIGLSEDMPFDNGSFDLVFSDNVLEHLAEPKKTFEEVARVLRPGGRFLFKTPNRYHYMPAIAQLTPNSFHRYFNELRGRRSADTFPTLYRANTPRRIGQLAEATGFSVNKIDLIEARPEYLRFSAATYLMGLAYERLVNSSRFFGIFRILLIGDLVRNSD